MVTAGPPSVSRALPRLAVLAAATGAVSALAATAGVGNAAYPVSCAIAIALGLRIIHADVTHVARTRARTLRRALRGAPATPERVRGAALSVVRRDLRRRAGLLGLSRATAVWTVDGWAEAVAAEHPSADEAWADLALLSEQLAALPDEPLSRADLTARVDALVRAAEREARARSAPQRAAGAEAPRRHAAVSGR